MILSSIGGAIVINQNMISKKFFEDTLKRIFRFTLKKGKPKYKILDLMKENMKNLNTLKSTNEIKKLINYSLKEF